MGSIDNIKRLSSVLRSAINKFQQQQEKNSNERQELNPGLLSEKQACYLCAMQTLNRLHGAVTVSISPIVQSHFH